MTIPLFPLNSLVCPGGRIPLQIFEPRYLDMLSRCMSDGSGFVIVLMEEGVEAGGPSRFYSTGTRVDIVDFSRLPNGLLGIVAEGREIVRVSSFDRQEDGLYVGEIELLDPEPAAAVSDAFAPLVEILEALLRHPVVRDLGMQVDLSDARQLGWRLTELLPLRKRDKQRLLECAEPEQRLALIQDFLLELG